MPVRQWGSIPGWSKCLYGECDPPDDDHAAWRSVRPLYSMRFYNYGAWLFEYNSVLEHCSLLLKHSGRCIVVRDVVHGFVYVLPHLDIVRVYIWGVCILEHSHVHIQRMAARQKNSSLIQLIDLTVNQANIAAYRPLGTIIAPHPLDYQHQQSTTTSVSIPTA